MVIDSKTPFYSQNNLDFIFWHERQRCSRSSFRRSTGNARCGQLFSPFFAFGPSGQHSSQTAFGRSTGNIASGHYFQLSLPLPSIFPLSPPSTFLMEGVIGSRNLFQEKLGVDTFPDPFSHFGAPSDHFVFYRRFRW